jgi:hypothetical protein
MPGKGTSAYPAGGSKRRGRRRGTYRFGEAPTWSCSRCALCAAGSAQHRCSLFFRAASGRPRPTGRHMPSGRYATPRHFMAHLVCSPNLPTRALGMVPLADLPSAGVWIARAFVFLLGSWFGPLPTMRARRADRFPANPSATQAASQHSEPPALEARRGTLAPHARSRTRDGGSAHDSPSWAKKNSSFPATRVPPAWR